MFGSRMAGSAIMKSTIFGILLGMTSMGVVIGEERSATTEEPVVLAQDLEKMRVPGRVAAVLWTRRSDYYTLQIAKPNMGRILRVSAQDTSFRSQPSNIQMWLLRADGTVITPLWRSIDPAPEPASSAKKGPATTPMTDVIFRYPLSAGTQAVAAAIQIGDTFIVDQIEPEALSVDPPHSPVRSSPRQTPQP
jgi:hypothetical protein